MKWSQFAIEAPVLARCLRKQFEGAGVVLVGTLRADGSPRLSPVEPVFEGEHFYLDMMHSYKALDLLRDSRLEVHAVPLDRNAPQYKLRGCAVESVDEEELTHVAVVCKERFGWEPYPGHHLFRMDVESAVWVSYGEDASDGYMRTRMWDSQHGYVERGPYPPPGAVVGQDKSGGDS